MSFRIPGRHDESAAVSSPRVVPSTLAIRWCLLTLVMGMSVNGTTGLAQDSAIEAADSDVIPDLPPLNVPSDPGQADLDEAVTNKIGADTGKKLEKVVDLLESAIAKGLSDDNRAFATKMLSSVQLELGQGLFGAFLQRQGKTPGLLERAKELIEQSVQNNPDSLDAQISWAQLNALPSGDQKAGLDAATKAIELIDDDKLKLSDVYVLRSRFQESDDDKLKDLDLALESNPQNKQAFETRIGLRLDSGEIDQAIKEVEQLLEREPLNMVVIRAAATALTQAKRNDDALSLLTKAIDSQKEPARLEQLYQIRSDIHSLSGNSEAAIADLDRASEFKPDDPLKLLRRAQLKIRNEDVAGAKSDLRRAVRLEPRLAVVPESLTLEYMIAMQENRINDAISNVQKLVEFEKKNPSENSFFQLELGRLYAIDQRNRQAIEVFDEFLADNAGDVDALRSRGDAYLAVGDHQSAVTDYAEAIRQLENEIGAVSELQATDEQAPPIRGLLNNLSWVLATSPDDDVRDGSRALELGREAARLSDFAAPHILSTLAAAYAESGDLQKAIEYSQRGVDLGDAEVLQQETEEAKQEKLEQLQLDQLRQELETYRRGETWREKQDIEENDKPIINADDLIDI